MKTTVTAIAHPNIALAKYWGKSDAEENVPAVPSLSVTLAGMSTTTTVTFDDALGEDSVAIDGAPADARAHARAVALVDRVRRSARIGARVRVESRNDFPTASGLASSASGFAALAAAASRAAGFDWSAERVADLARRSSASAARSVFGGFVELDGGDGARGVARQVAPASALDLRVLVAVTTESKKAVSSTDGMAATATDSPYWRAWLDLAPRLCADVRAALLASDFEGVGALAEKSALAMHACALGAGIVYASEATFAALREVRAMRTEGLAAYATIDAGAHLKCLVRSGDVAAAKARLAGVTGVLRVLETRPGEGAHVVVVDSDVAAGRASR